jgi:hypothetical protein
MIIKRSRVTAAGKRELVVELDSLDEKLIAVAEHRYYQLGGQVEDIMPGHVLLEASHVCWCPFEQKWVAP